MINEIESDRKWDKLFAESEEVLSPLTLEALEEKNSGKQQNLTQVNYDIQGSRIFFFLKTIMTLFYRRWKKLTADLECRSSVTAWCQTITICNYPGISTAIL